MASNLLNKIPNPDVRHSSALPVPLRSALPVLHHPCLPEHCSRLFQVRPQLVREQEMAQMIDLHLWIEAVHCDLLFQSHHARVADERVQPLPLDHLVLFQVVRAGAHGGEGGQVAVDVEDGGGFVGCIGVSVFGAAFPNFPQRCLCLR